MYGSYYQNNCYPCQPQQQQYVNPQYNIQWQQQAVAYNQSNCNPCASPYQYPQIQYYNASNPCYQYNQCYPGYQYNPCNPCNPSKKVDPCKPCDQITLKGGDDFFNLQVKELNEIVLGTAIDKPIRVLAGGRNAILVVNIATTPTANSQRLMRELENIRRDYPNGKLEILAFPSNSFGNTPQAAAAALEAAINGLVANAPPNFRILGDQNNQVIGADAHDVHKWLAKNGVTITEDFQMVLINRCGQIVSEYKSSVGEPTIRKDIHDLYFS